MTLLRILFSLCGGALSAYLFFSAQNSTMACTGSDCSAVIHSEHADFLGYPLSAIGLGFFITNFYWAWRSLRPVGVIPHPGHLLIVNSLALCAVPYLLYLMFGVIKHVCAFCITSHCLILILFLLSFLEYRRFKNSSSHPRHTRFPIETLVATLILFLTPFSLKQLTDRIALQKPDQSEDPVIAEFDGTSFHLSELEAAIKVDLYREKIRLRDQWLTNKILEKAASSMNLSVDDYIIQKVYSNVTVSEKEIQEFIENNHSEIPEIQDEEEKKLWVESRIGNQKAEDAIAAQVEILKKEYAFKSYTPDSEKFLLPEDIGNGPRMGEETAPVTLVVYSDFSCHFCSLVHRDILEQINQHPGKITYHYKFYSNQVDDAGMKINALAYSAFTQGKFWEVADHLHQSDLESLEIDRLIDSVIEKFSLDRESTLEEIDSGSAGKRVMQDIEQGRKMGIRSTPTIFINGTLVTINKRKTVEKYISQEIDLLSK